MLEVLLAGGLDPMHAMRMLIPPAWQSVDMIDPDLKAFYEYYATHMEPWDGPAGIVLTDGRYACCTLDRNGLRPARWVITKNRHITIASEAGVWDYLPEDVVDKGKLGPGEMLALDLQTAELMDTQARRRSLEKPASLQGVAEKGRALSADRSHRSAPRGRAIRPRHAGAVSENVQRVGRRARRNHPGARRGRKRSGGLDGR